MRRFASSSAPLERETEEDGRPREEARGFARARHPPRADYVAEEARVTTHARTRGSGAMARRPEVGVGSEQGEGCPSNQDIPDLRKEDRIKVSLARRSARTRFADAGPVKRFRIFVRGCARSLARDTSTRCTTPSPRGG